MYAQSVVAAKCVSILEEPMRHTPSNVNYYPQVSITSLMKILSDTTLSMHHSAVTQGITVQHNWPLHWQFRYNH